MYKDLKSGKVSSRLNDLVIGHDLLEESVRSFLRYGYVVGDQTLFNGISYFPEGKLSILSSKSIRNILKNNKPITFRDALVIGARTWNEVMDKCLLARNGEIVVPISGGIDSRFILGAILENLDASQIYTYTFGSPGAWDFEIGNLVAKKCGTKHISYDLSGYQYKIEGLQRVAAQNGGGSNLFTCIPLDLIERDFDISSSEFWIGFMGDPSMGSHVPKCVLKDQLDSAYYLDSKERFCSDDMASLIGPVGLADGDVFCIDREGLEDTGLTAEEIWDFENRQLKYVLSQISGEGMRTVFPFIDSRWLDFSLNLPKELREGMVLYKELATRMYPKLFSLPIKNNYGLPLNVKGWKLVFKKVENRLRSHVGNWCINKGINYIDFEKGFKEREDLKLLVRECMQSLSCRDVVKHLSHNSDWLEYISKKGSSRDLSLLCSLEIILRTYYD